MAAARAGSEHGAKMCWWLDAACREGKAGMEELSPTRGQRHRGHQLAHFRVLPRKVEGLVLVLKRMFIKIFKNMSVPAPHTFPPLHLA